MPGCLFLVWAPVHELVLLPDGKASSSLLSLSPAPLISSSLLQIQFPANCCRPSRWVQQVCLTCTSPVVEQIWSRWLIEDTVSEQPQKPCWTARMKIQSVWPAATSWTCKGAIMQEDLASGSAAWTDWWCMELAWTGSAWDRTGVKEAIFTTAVQHYQTVTG